MKGIDEIISFAAYLGNTISEEALAEISFESAEADKTYSGSVRYVIACSDLNTDMRRQLGIGQIITEYFRRHSIHLCVFLFIENMVLIGGQIHKYKIIDYSNGEQSYYETEPNLQEIRIVRRLLDYITKETGDIFH